MADDLSRLDRATLAVWRFANASVWTVAALLAAVVIHLAFVGLMRHPAIDLYPHVPYQFLASAGLSLLIGLAIGGIIGVRAWRWQPALAAVASCAYVAVALVLFRRLLGWPTNVTTTVYPSDNGQARSVAIGFADLPLTAAYWVVVASITILVASLWARRIARRGSQR